MELTLSNRLTWAMGSVVFLLLSTIIWGDLPPDSNLLLHYQFEGDALDSSVKATMVRYTAVLALRQAFWGRGGF